MKNYLHSKTKGVGQKSHFIKKFRSPTAARMTRYEKKLDISAFSYQSATANTKRESGTIIYVPGSFL